ncbi:NmrA-like family protein [Colletotrichum truncatum]|uniref:NmrA-like family protein n=1 Tax=Colletotrichum truncatum TaxID=5467 RepID=A0ACC3YXW9_COLTU|nr:NmrA-like family protein [Colletotrichum truncatum]KAF6790874.1 NmrA-like family protein [Colletotrichum truncatum]
MEQHIVIVGGAGSVGHSIVEELAKYGIYKISVWTRKEISTAVIPNGAQGVQVTDYTDHDQLVKLLTGVNTVLAFINPMGDPGNATQKALIDACIAAKVRRFAPSEWAGKTYTSIEMYKHKAEVLDYLKEVNKETTVLEYGLFQPGLLMDYLAHPYPPSKHTNTFALLFDLLGARAVVVEDGSASMCFTAAADVGKVVARAIQSDEPWPVEGGIVGEKVTMSDLVKIGEKVTGKSFEVHTVKAADLEAGEWKATWQPTFNEALSAGDTKKLVVPFISGWALGIYKGLIDLEPDWNRRFPNIKFTSVEEMLNAAWERAKADVKA